MTLSGRTTAQTIDATRTSAEPASAVRVGAVQYLNTVPLIAGLEKAAGLDIRLEPPARLIDLLAPSSQDAAPEVDLALCSIIDYQRSPSPLEIVPVGVIACDGPTRTVRVYSRVPFEQVSTLHVDIESHTSVALASIILAEQFKVRPEIVPFDGNSAGGDQYPDTLLLIGDKTMTHAPPESSHPYQLDLGAAWRDITGLPFVYAAWMCRAGEYASRPEVRTIAALLDRQRRRNCVRVGWSAAQSAATHGWAPEAATDYMTTELRYDLDDDAKHSIEQFFDRARNAGVIETVTPIVWAGSSAAPGAH